jgi:hypothetical protein
MAIKIPTISIPKPSKIYPNWDFWYENVHTIWQPVSCTDFRFLVDFSDDHEVDVIGYGGATSDDDHSSIRSSGSDGGVAVTTWKQLSIVEEI